MDPFSLTADAATYQPREATESALNRLEDGFRRGRRVQVLSGPPGLGKTLLAHVLAVRLERVFRSVYLPYASLGWRDLCTWILGLLGEPPGAFPDRELLASARRGALQGRPLLLLADEASGLPPESANALADLVAEADGAIRLLLIPLDDARAGRVLAVLARDVAELRLSAPLTLEETERYVRTRLVRAHVPLDLQRRFDAGMLARLHRAAAGNLRQLHHLASEVLRGNTATLPGSEAFEALGVLPDEQADELEVDASAAGEGAREAPDEDFPALAGPRAAAGTGAARSTPPRVRPPAANPPAPAPIPTAAPAAVARPPATSFDPPAGPREPEPTNWWLVIAFNAAIAGGLLAGLWWGGLFPPP